MTTAPRHLCGNHAPVAEELTAHDLPVTGTIPPGLSGWYLRNGPNPAGPRAARAATSTPAQAAVPTPPPAPAA
ncbi:carotenoid oxygenase family protein, partial [Streptomyces sp. NPDC004561]